MEYTQKLVLGVDEAGRGPVIGSLFIAGALFDEKEINKLKNLGVKDSKLLSNSTRFNLRDKIKKIAKKTKIIKVEPYEIDLAVGGHQGLNLNWLEAHKTAQIINELKPDRAIIDCPSPNISKYKAYLIKLLENKDVELVIEHKADLKYVECGAASILAKCEREDEVSALKKKIGLDFGSGYPSDPLTIDFLEKNHERYRGIFRESWAPYKKHKDKKNQKELYDF